MLMCNFATPKADAELHFFSFLQPFGRAYDIELQVIFISLGTKLDLLDRDLNLVLLRFAFFAALFVLELAVIHDAADRWIGIWRYFNQIQANIIRTILGRLKVDHTNIGVGVVNEPNFAYTANVSVDPMW